MTGFNFQNKSSHGNSSQVLTKYIQWYKLNISVFYNNEFQKKLNKK